MLATDDRLDEQTLRAVIGSGHSRIPVYHTGNREHIAGCARCAAGRLGGWAVGCAVRLRGWALGGGCAVLLGGWAVWRLGALCGCAVGRLRWLRCAAGRSGGLAVGCAVRLRGWAVEVVALCCWAVRWFGRVGSAAGRLGDFDGCALLLGGWVVWTGGLYCCVG
eukprot:248897-Chlamydomonas_euryale.AAC.1